MIVIILIIILMTNRYINNTNNTIIKYKVILIRNYATLHSTFKQITLNICVASYYVALWLV